MRALLAVLPLALLACDATTSGASDAGVDAARDTRSGTSTPDNCHHDCFGRALCSDGSVTVWGHGPVPCWAWQGSCPIETSFRCEKGCRTDGVTSLTAFERHAARTLCEENRPKKVGDRCSSDADCTPTPAVKTSETTVDNTYLRCDTASGTCVEAPAPVIAGYLAPCGIDPTKVPKGGRGMTYATGCPSGVCLYAWTEACVAEGCTIRCTGDHECPEGSVCEPTYYDDEPDSGVPYGYCKPGPLDVYGPGLACVMPSDAGGDG